VVEQPLVKGRSRVRFLWPGTNATAALPARSDDMEPLIHLLIVLVIIGVVWYLFDRFVPMAAPMKAVITAIAVIALCIWLLQFLGAGHLRI
jgi:hypothetical protein